jgi:3'-phosphoadenosine 5'-phosphosulfate synthase
MEILPFGKVYYDKRDHVMKDMDPSREDDFISISGSKMRTLARNGAVPCDVSNGKKIPSDLEAENCVPPGFMVQSGWDIVCDYYQHVDDGNWVPYSVMNVDPFVGKHTSHEGAYGTTQFELWVTDAHSNKIISSWHDVALYPSSGSDNIIQFVTEIPMYSTAKMEMCKTCPHNPIMQDTKNGKPRYYYYGTPFFNYGFLPQTWESPQHQDATTKAYGDNDPIDVIELGDSPLAMGTVSRGKVLGALELIDEGETDHKILVLREDDPHFESIHSIEDLERYKPHTISKLVDWLKNYKTAEGKGQNTLTHEHPVSVEVAKGLIKEVHQFYQELIDGTVSQKSDEEEFYLPR